MIRAILLLSAKGLNALSANKKAADKDIFWPPTEEDFGVPQGS